MAFLDEAGLRRFFDGLKNKFVGKSMIINNLTTQEAGYVLDARQGHEIQERIDDVGDVANQKASVSTTSAVLPASGWADGMQTIMADGVTATNTIDCAPAPGSFIDWCSAMARCTEQTDGKLTFVAEKVPEVDLVVNIKITTQGGGGQ